MPMLSLASGHDEKKLNNKNKNDKYPRGMSRVYSQIKGTLITKDLTPTTNRQSCGRYPPSLSLPPQGLSNLLYEAHIWWGHNMRGM